jgi:hypothetical protein
MVGWLSAAVEKLKKVLDNMATEKNYDEHLRLASRDNSVAGNELGEDITGSLDNDHECATKPPFRHLAGICESTVFGLVERRG